MLPLAERRNGSIHQLANRELRAQRHREVRRLLPASTVRRRTENLVAFSVIGVIWLTAGIAAVAAGIFVARAISTAFGGT